MGAGQIGGIATLIDIDFNNAAGFQGVKAEYSEGQFVTYYLSHALLFCVGALIEPHVVLTPAICVFGEKYKFDVFAGTHSFILNTGIHRTADHLCIHKAYNHTQRWTECSPYNMALIVLDQPFSFHQRELHAEYILSRLRYGPTAPVRGEHGTKCHYYGFGSRRNGFLIPLLIHMRKVEVVILPEERCLPMWNHNNQLLCIQEIPCKSQKFGALCPDDVGSVIECSGFAVGMMVSRLIDRPCGIGFLDLQKNLKFITCGVDDARDVMTHDPYLSFDFISTTTGPQTPSIITVPTPTAEYEELQPLQSDPEVLVPETESPTTEKIGTTTEYPTAKMRKGRNHHVKNEKLRQRTPSHQSYI